MLTHRRNDDGSVVVAITIILVLTTLAVAVMTRAVSGQDSSKRNQDFSAALGQADAGVSDALLRIDQLGASNPPSQFCVGPSTACGVSSLPQAPGTQYVATSTSPDLVIVRSKGIKNGVPHAVEARVERSRLFPFAVFGKTSLRFNGTSGGNIYPVDAAGNTITSIEANAGSNNDITCQGGGGGQNNVVYPGGQISGCSNPVFLTNGQYNPQDPVASNSCSTIPTNTPPTPCIPPTATCPASGGLLPAVLNPGRYLCTSSVRFPSTTTVASGASNAGVVEIFVIPSSGTANVDFDGSNVNVTGDPTKLRVYMAGAGQVIVGNGAHAGAFTGIMWAPSANITNNGCKADWRGAVLFNTVTCNGGPNLGIKYDIRVANLTDQNWKVTDYREIPSRQVVLP